MHEVCSQHIFLCLANALTIYETGPFGWGTNKQFPAKIANFTLVQKCTLCVYNNLSHVEVYHNVIFFYQSRLRIFFLFVTQSIKH